MKLLKYYKPGDTICIISGDSDFLSVVKEILNNPQINLEVWSFKKGNLSHNFGVVLIFSLNLLLTKPNVM